MANKLRCVQLDGTKPAETCSGYSSTRKIALLKYDVNLQSEGVGRPRAGFLGHVTIAATEITVSTPLARAKRSVYRPTSMRFADAFS
jgi:hypothetical protein